MSQFTSVMWIFLPNHILQKMYQEQSLTFPVPLLQFYLNHMLKKKKKKKESEKACYQTFETVFSSPNGINSYGALTEAIVLYIDRKCSWYFELWVIDCVWSDVFCFL